MTKRKATITVDPEKAAEANRLVGSTNFSATVEKALDLLIRQEHGRRDAEAYERQPPTAEELAFVGTDSEAVLDDDTDWETLYRDVQ